MARTARRRQCRLSVLAGLAWLCAGAAPGRDEVVRATLDNGLRVVIVPSRLAPVVTLEMSYLVGSNEAPFGYRGLAHAEEHMMFRGSPGLSAAQLSTIIAGLGGDFDAETGYTVTQYYFTVPKAGLEMALNIEAIRMRDVLDAPEFWTQELGALNQEVSGDLSDPGFVLHMRLLTELFADTPYAVSPLGSRESLARTTVAMLKDFHRSWYGPNNAVLVVAGDLDADATLAQVRRLFSPIPARPTPGRAAAKLKPVVPSKIVLDSDLPYGLAVVAFRLPGFDSPDYAAGRVLGDVLASPRGHLAELMVEGRALGTQFTSEPFAPAGLGYAIATFARGAEGEPLLSEIKNRLMAYAEGGVASDEVEAAKRQAVTSAELSKGSIPGLAAEWARAIAMAGWTSPEVEIEAIRRVTTADVSRVARDYLRKNALVTALALPRVTGGMVTLKPPHRRESFARSQVEPVSLPSWAEGVMAPPHPADVTPPRAAVTSVVLSNGLRVIVRPTPSVPAVSLYGEVKNDSGLQVPRGQEGVDQVLAELMDYGTSSLDRDAFQKALGQIGATATVGTSFSLQALPEHFERGTELLAQNMLHPALPEKAFATVLSARIAAVAGLLGSPAYLAQQALKRGLYPKGDPARRETTPTSLGRLTLADVRRYHASVFRPDLTTIVVTGQITPEQALATLERQFGGWTAAGHTPKTDPPRVPPNPPSAQAVRDASRGQDQVVLAETLGITRSDPDYYPLQVANHVLSGGFYATRLYRDLRETAGLVYHVSSTLRADKTRSIYAITFGCDPDNVGRVRKMVEQDLQQMRSTLVTPDELQRTKALLLRQLPLAEASIDRIAGGLIERALQGLPLDEPTRAARRYLAITDEQVRAAFARWVQPERLVQVTLGPLPSQQSH